MTVVVVLTAQPLDLAGYEAVASAVGWSGRELPGLSLHVAGLDGVVLRVTDVWADATAAHDFLDGSLRPALRDAGVVDVTTELSPSIAVRVTAAETPRRILVVANRTLGTAQLVASLRSHLATEPCELHLLVPAEPVGAAGTDDEYGDPALPRATVAATSDDLARTRLYAELDRLHHLGVAATGEVAGDDAVEAVREALRRRRYDEILLSTLPPGASRWLGRDLPSRLQRAVDVPVNVVIASAGDV
jgi:hypothetical protein